MNYIRRRQNLQKIDRLSQDYMTTKAVLQTPIVKYMHQCFELRDVDISSGCCGWVHGDRYNQGSNALVFIGIGMCYGDSPRACCCFLNEMNKTFTYQIVPDNYGSLVKRGEVIPSTEVLDRSQIRQVDLKTYTMPK